MTARDQPLAVAAAAGGGEAIEVLACRWRKRREHRPRRRTPRWCRAMFPAARDVAEDEADARTWQGQIGLTRYGTQRTRGALLAQGLGPDGPHLSTRRATRSHPATGRACADAGFGRQ